MSDLKKYVEKRKARDPEFAERYEVGYLEFKIGVLFRQAREEASLTRAEVAQKLNTQKSAISISSKFIAVLRDFCHARIKKRPRL